MATTAGLYGKETRHFVDKEGRVRSPGWNTTKKTAHLRLSEGTEESVREGLQRARDPFFDPARNL